MRLLLIHRFRLLTLVALAAALIGLGNVPSGGAADAAGSFRTDVIIGFKGQPGPAEQALVHQAGGTIKYTYHLVPAIAATVPKRAIAGLQANPNVTSVDLDDEVHAIDAELDNAWGVKRIGAGTVHDGSNKGTGVKVAVIDTGIAYTHPDLDANYVGGHDFVNGDTNPMDDNGHGTHVAGTIAAEDNDTGVVGAAPEAALYGLKVLNSSGSGSWSDIIAAVEWAADNGIQVTNNSYSGSRRPGRTVKAAFDNSAAAGVLHVAAAGNSGCGGKGNSVGWPARFTSVIAVAATDQNDQRPCFSSTGSDVELAAPGVSVNSTLWGGYGTKSGTSMASPHVAGTAALVIAAGIADVRLQLQQTADDLGDPGRDSEYGFGLVNAANAATPAGPVNVAPTVSITGPADGSAFGSGTTISFAGSAGDTAGGDLTASLGWTSDIDGPIGTGDSFSTTLSDGNHTITVSVTDSGGETGSASISITVGTPPPSPTLSVTVTTDKTSYLKRETTLITVTVTDGANPVDAAAVHVEITTAKGRKQADDGTTDANANGVAVFKYKVNSKRDGVGTYTVVATASKDGHESGSGSTKFEVTS